MIAESRKDKRMKRLIALLLALMMLLGQCFALAEGSLDATDDDTEIVSDEDEFIDGEDDELILDEDGEEDEESGDEEEDLEDEDEDFEDEEEEFPWVEYDYETLYVANPTHMDGKFFTDMWGNATTDIDVRTLVHGYRLISWDYEFGMFRENHSVCNGLLVTDDDLGNRTYTLYLYDDLFYSDGTPITAWDYAFSVLFQVQPMIADLGGLPMNLEFLKGYEEYIDPEDEIDYFSGVRVLDNYSISFTVKKEFLPYFFEMFRFSFVPYPIHEIAPGCKVYDDGKGVYIDNEDRTIEEKLFTQELIELTVMDKENGYLYYPTVGSGPYVLTYWDGEICRFDINPYFKGDEDGYKPTIPHLEFTLGVNETMIDQLVTGEFGLLNKVTRADTIIEGLQRTAERSQYTMTNYPRIGLTFIVFTPDRVALQQQKVRQAINHCLEKEEVVRDYVGGFGTAMDGLIGLGQWMYGLVMGTIPYPIELSENPTPEEEREYEALLAEWESLTLDNLWHYDLDVEYAIKLLEQDGWTLNEKGEPFVRGEDEVRYRMIDGELVGLDLTCAYPETNITAESFNELFIPHLADAGIKLTLIPMDMKTLLKSYNDRDIEEIDMFYLGDDFNIEFDPTLFFVDNVENLPLDPDSLPWVHDLMFDLADFMCRTEPGEVLEFMKKWIYFQEKLSEYLPMIPVYSNVYFDFYTRELQNYDILYHITWGDAIVPAFLATPPDPEEEEEEVEGEEGEEDEDEEEEKKGGKKSDKAEDEEEDGEEEFDDDELEFEDEDSLEFEDEEE